MIPVIQKQITFFGKQVMTGCDANCQKAWGLNGGRPRIYFNKRGEILFVRVTRRMQHPSSKDCVWSSCDEDYCQTHNQMKPCMAEFDDDNFAYAPDQLCDTAPSDPGTYEGGHAKPIWDGDRLNKWCVRECERNQFAPHTNPLGPIDCDDWSKFVFNMPDIRKLVEARPNWEQELTDAILEAKRETVTPQEGLEGSEESETARP
jgi:hypothetical protein